MSKIHFQIGNQNFVQISLPSKMNGDGDWFVGKAKLRVDSLSCSHFVRIYKEHLALFFADVAKAYETLKGEFVVNSSSPGFALRGEMTSKGQVIPSCVNR